MTAATIHKWTCSGQAKHELSFSDEGQPELTEEILGTNMRLIDGKPCAICGATVTYTKTTGHIE